MKELILKEARLEDVEDILELYEVLLDELESNINYPKWTKNYYPNLDYIVEKVNAHELFCVFSGDELISVFVLNEAAIDDYDSVDWSLDLTPEEVYFMHTFAVRNDLRGKGIGQDIIKLIKDFAREKNKKALRLDTINGNTPAVHFYQKAGFTNLGIYELNYEETDEKYFSLFELNL